MVKAKLGRCSLFSNFIHYSLFLRGTHPPTSITVAAGGQFVTFCSQSLREKNFSLISISVKKRPSAILQTVLLTVGIILWPFCPCQISILQEIFNVQSILCTYTPLVCSHRPVLRVQKWTDHGSYIRRSTEGICPESSRSSFPAGRYACPWLWHSPSRILLAPGS